MKTITQIVTINAFPTTITVSLSTSGKSQVSKNHTWLPISTSFPSEILLSPKSFLRFPTDHFFGKTTGAKGHLNIIVATSMETRIYDTSHSQNKSSWTFNKSGKVVDATIQALRSNIIITL